jgi:hypothetical protein
MSSPVPFGGDAFQPAKVAEFLAHPVTTYPTEPEAFRLLALKGALKLEILGMRRRGPSALSIVRGMGINARSAKDALPLYVAHLQALGLLAS